MFDEQAVKEIAASVGDLTDGPAARQSLREAYPHLQFSLCSEDDINEDLEPVGETAGFFLYLLDGHDHCLRLTSDPEMATGVVLAEKME